MGKDDYRRKYDLENLQKDFLSRYWNDCKVRIKRISNEEPIWWPAKQFLKEYGIEFSSLLWAIGNEWPLFRKNVRELYRASGKNIKTNDLDKMVFTHYVKNHYGANLTQWIKKYFNISQDTIRNMEIEYDGKININKNDNIYTNDSYIDDWSDPKVFIPKETMKEE